MPERWVNAVILRLDGQDDRQVADHLVAEMSREAQQGVEGRRSGMEIGAAAHGLQGRTAHGNDGTDIVHSPQIVGIEGRPQERDDPVSRDIEGVAVEGKAVLMCGERAFERLHGTGRQGVAGCGEDDKASALAHTPGRTPKVRDTAVVGPQPQGLMVEAEKCRPGLRGADALAREPRLEDGDGVPGMTREDRQGGATTYDPAGTA